jgi:SIR2-like protein
MKKDFYPSAFLPLRFSSLSSVARCIDTYRDFNRGVITYNYDDLLEKTFESETSLSYQTIFKDDEIKNKDVNIYHVHGYLPRTGHLKSEHSKSIILSEQKYNYLFNNPLSWQITNQLTRFRENLCVLVGLSISDPSLRRLLESVKMSNPMKFHYAILAKVSRKHTSSLSDILAITKHFERIGVHIIWVDNYSDIPGVIDSLYI